MSFWILIQCLLFAGLEFISTETPDVLSVRLEVLCDENREDSALQLVTLCRNYLKISEDTRFLEACSQEQQDFWLDLQLILLYHQEKRRPEILPILEDYSLEDNYKLVQRLVNRQPSKSRVWRKSLKTAEFVTAGLLSNALMRSPPPARLVSLAVQMVKFQKPFKAAIDVFIKMVDANKLVTSSHLHVLCETFANQVNSFPCKFH